MNVLHKLNPHFVELYSDQLSEDMPIERVKARELLVKPNRFDIILKYCYIEAFAEGYLSLFFEEMFKEQVACMTSGSFREGDGQKSSYQDFVVSFRDLYLSIKENGFSEDTSLIPINNNGECLDGAHRLAVAAYLNLEVHIVRVDLSVGYNSTFFKKNKMQEKFLDFAALKLVELSPTLHVLNIHSAAPLLTEKVISLLNEKTLIYYKKEIKVNRNFYKFLTFISYKNEDWIGTLNNNFVGARDSFYKYYGSKPLRVYIVSSKNDDNLLELKENIRSCFSIGNSAIHITDTHAEALDLSQILLNSNSLDLLSKSKIFERKYLKDVFQSISEFKMWMSLNNLKYKDFVVDGSSVLGLYGLRETRDIDFLTDISKVPFSMKFDNHDEYLGNHISTKADLLHNPDNFLYFDGVKFITPEVLLKFKTNRNEKPKDPSDIKLIGLIQKYGISKILNELLYLLETIKKLRKMNITQLRLYFKSQFTEHSFGYRLLKSFFFFYRLIFRGKTLKNRDTKYMKDVQHKSMIGDIDYFGFRLKFSPGTSIVNRFLSTGKYEQEEIDVIINLLEEIEGEKVMLDIGANIGMISLAVKSNVEGLTIHAFEPGPHQFKYLKENVKENNLESQISLWPLAIAETTGKRTFAIHCEEDASGDGFVDTERAGGTSTITVDTIMLDDWWVKQRSPRIHLIKIDVEGAELLVLEGANKLIMSQKPVILFELYNKNLINYPYDHQSIFEKIESFGYRILNLNLSEISQNQLEKLSGSSPYGGDFLAFYEKN
jgi:FkbM family methyltransferase